MTTPLTLTDADAARIAQAHAAGRIDANYMTPLELKEFARMTTDVQPCCYLECEKPAEWEIWDSAYPESNTMACSDHVGHLLTDDYVHNVYRITDSAASSE